MKYLKTFRFRSAALAEKLHLAESAIRCYVIGEELRTGYDSGSGFDLPPGCCRGAVLVNICTRLGVINSYPDAECGCPHSGWLTPAIVEINPAYSEFDARGIALEIIGAIDTGNPKRALELAIQVLWHRRQHLRALSSQKDSRMRSTGPGGSQTSAVGLFLRTVGGTFQECPAN